MDQLEKSGHKMKMKLLQDLLKCNICLETLSNPKILQCHHFFCSTCIQSHHENSQEGNQAFCPICRRPFVLDFSGAEDLPPCHFVNELLEKFSKEPNLKTNTEIERNCQGLCLKRKSKVKATFSCPPCGIDLCEVCLEAHQFFNAHHKIVDVEDYQRPIMIQSPEMEDENLLCDQHTDHNLSELCLDCKAVLCQVCKKKHHDHNCISLEDIKSEAQMMRNMLRRIKSDLERRREDVTTFEFFLKTSETKAIKRIQSTHKEIKERIDTQKTESEEKLKLHSESLTIEIAESLTKIDTNSKSVESILELIHTLLAFGNDRCFLMYWQNIHDRYQSIDLENVELPNVESKDIIRFNPTDLEKLSIGYLTPAKPDIEWMNKDQNQDEEEREDEKEIEDYTDCMINTAHMLRGSHLYSFLPQKPLNPVNSKRHALRVLPKPPKLKTVIEQKTPVPHFHGEHNTYLSLLTEQG
ncbi:E3 ubiquitin-protein ligase TRIM56-like [Saccostrea cucullata]|uniref:E3 ubiquitin-protein ligase TRIM56-like n=1 Tax=Saccostrea cuccullata TaxID=36930 RepID=UPI002ED3EA39